MKLDAKRVLVGMACAVTLLIGAPARSADVEAAEMLARQSGCFKCHAIDKKKDGPPYRAVATKYRGQAEAPDKLYLHVTTGPKVKFQDGSEDNHKIIQTTDIGAIRNLIEWILSL